MSELPTPIIYQLKVVLLGVSPMIWRRLLVCGDSTITDLRYILQIAMGWSDDHLHQFRIHGKRYGIAWIRVDHFDRKAVNRQLYDHARGENVFMWF